MELTEVIRRVNGVLVEDFELEEESLTPDADLYEDLELDSLDSVDLVAGLEREFGVKIDRQANEETVRSMRTLQDVYDFVIQLAAAQ